MGLGHYAADFRPLRATRDRFSLKTGCDPLSDNFSDFVSHDCTIKRKRIGFYTLSREDLLPLRLWLGLRVSLRLLRSLGHCRTSIVTKQRNRRRKK